jgi:hypothetical protein
VSFNHVSGVEHARNQEYVHRVNTERGWYDTPLSFLDAMALLTTEVVEISDGYAEEGLTGGAQKLRGGWLAGPQMASEFADCYIRLADACSRFHVDLGVVVDICRHSYQQRTATSFDGTCMQLVRRIRDVIEAYRVEGLDGEGSIQSDTRKAVAYLFLQLQDACDEFGVDLMRAFDLKMAVNATRSYRHGNKHA